MLTRFQKLHSLKWRILSIAFICVIGFAAYLALVLNQSNANASLLKEIREVRYPVQANLLASRFHLQQFYRELEIAAITGDEDNLNNAEPVASAFRTSMAEIKLLMPGSVAAINDILSRFEQYRDTSTSLVTDMLSGELDYEKIRQRGELSTHLYHFTSEALEDFNDLQDREFTDSIAHASQSASDFLLLASTAGAITALTVLFIAVYTAQRILRRIDSMVSSLKRIAQDDGDMSVRIKLEGRDEMTDLAFWFNTFIQKLETVTTNSTAEIKRIAYTDNLSGLPNRRRLMESLELELDTPIEDTLLAVFFLDLDNFKPVNDQLGHEGGDQLIRQVSQRLNSIIYEQIARPQNPEVHNRGLPVVGRLGGDEFMIIHPGIESKQHASQLAERIKQNVINPYQINGVTCFIGVSIGISLSPTDASSSGDLIDCADIAMYDAKNAGKNTFRFYDANVASTVESASLLLNELSSAIGTEQFKLVYQPKFRLQDDRYIGAEALLRWNSPRLGTVPPDQFINVAENTDLILQIDEYVFESVCQQLEHWNRAGLRPGRIAVNASARQIRRPDLIAFLRGIVERYDMDPCQLEIEITETSALSNLDQVISNINALHEMSIHVAMDDFGAGHSSLKLLLNADLDALKLDRSLSDQIDQDPRSRHILNSIIKLASVLNIETVAEGIETEAQLNLLRELECAIGQGYFYSAPISADDLAQLIEMSMALELRRAS